MLNGKKFGIEIEFLMPNRHSKSEVVQALAGIGITCDRSEGYTHHNGGGRWLLAGDSSVKALQGHDGCELVSPPVKDENGFEQIRKALNIIQKKFGAKVNYTCGLHVHHEWPSNYDKRKLAEFFLKYQEALYEVVKTGRSSNIYCQKLSHWNLNDIINHRGSDIRRHGLNFGPAANGHIEFRLHHGSTRFAEIRNWIILTQRVVEVSQTYREHPLIPTIKAKLAKSMYSVNELHRELTNDGVEVKKTELKKLLDGKFLELKFDDGEVRYSGSTYKTKTAELLEVLGFNKDEIATFFLGKEGLKSILGDVI